MKSKKGAKIISVYWFVILFIVAAAIVYMVAVFYGKPYDVRSLEADILIDKIAECLTYAGYVNDNVFVTGFEGNFLENCNLNFETEDSYSWNEQGQFYIEVKIDGFESSENFLDVAKGNFNLKDFCGLKGEGIPFCLERDFYSIDKSGNKYKITTLAVIKKIEKNA